MACWRTTCYKNLNNCANRDEISLEITSIIMGCCNYPNNYVSCDEMLFEITNIAMDVTTIQILVLVVMKQVLKALTLGDIVSITLYTQCKLHTQSQCKTSTNTHVSYEHKHQNTKEQKYHKKWDEKHNSFEL